VSSQQQSRAPGVALHSQLHSARTAAYLTLYALRPKLAQAALAKRRALSAGAALASPAADRRRHGRAAPLVIGYALAPVVALLCWWSLTPVLGSRAITGAVSALLLLLPPLLHHAYGAAARAWLGVASLLGYLLAGTAAGGTLARCLALRACAAQGPQECDLLVLGWLLAGACAGGLLAYGAHALRHVRLAMRSGAE
jgi:hypothetical protein